jgi:hypothetical protein
MKARASTRTPAAISAASVPPAISTPPSDPANGSKTRTIYRALLLRGLRPSEAANLTAFVCGIHVGDHQWRVDEVNRLLFLRELRASGRFVLVDGPPDAS